MEFYQKTNTCYIKELREYNRTDVWLENLLHDAGYDIVSNPGS